MSDSDIFVIVDSVHNFDAVLKREKRYLSLRFNDITPVPCLATGKMRTCGSADFLDLKMTKPNYKPNTGPNSNPNANPNSKQTPVLI